MSSRGFLILGALSLSVCIIFASLSFTGTLSWGYDIHGTYIAFANGRAQAALTGRRVIETNNGALALPIVPFFVTSVICFYAAIVGEHMRNWRDILGNLWVGAFISFPIYAIVFVDAFYDAGVTGAAKPAIVMFLPVVVALVLAWAQKLR